MIREKIIMPGYNDYKTTEKLLNAEVHEFINDLIKRKIISESELEYQKKNYISFCRNLFRFVSDEEFVFEGKGQPLLDPLLFEFTLNFFKTHIRIHAVTLKNFKDVIVEENSDEQKRLEEFLTLLISLPHIKQVDFSHIGFPFSENIKEACRFVNKFTELNKNNKFHKKIILPVEKENKIVTSSSAYNQKMLGFSEDEKNSEELTKFQAPTLEDYLGPQGENFYTDKDFAKCVNHEFFTTGFVGNKFNFSTHEMVMKFSRILENNANNIRIYIFDDCTFGNERQSEKERNEIKNLFLDTLQKIKATELWFVGMTFSLDELQKISKIFKSNENLKRIKFGDNTEQKKEAPEIYDQITMINIERAGPLPPEYQKERLPTGEEDCEGMPPLVNEKPKDFIPDPKEEERLNRETNKAIEKLANYWWKPGENHTTLDSLSGKEEKNKKITISPELEIEFNSAVSMIGDVLSKLQSSEPDKTKKDDLSKKAKVDLKEKENTSQEDSKKLFGTFSGFFNFSGEGAEKGNSSQPGKKGTEVSSHQGFKSVFPSGLPFFPSKNASTTNSYLGSASNFPFPGLKPNPLQTTPAPEFVTPILKAESGNEKEGPPSLVGKENAEKEGDTEESFEQHPGAKKKK